MLVKHNFHGKMLVIKMFGIFDTYLSMHEWLHPKIIICQCGFI